MSLESPSLTVVITGGNRGIGFGLTEQFLKNGSRVITTVRNPQKATSLANLKNRYPQLQTHTLDIASEDGLAHFVSQLKSLNSIDILINNAGVYLDKARGFETIPFESIIETYLINCVGTMRVTRACLPWLNMATHPKVVHITSRMGSIADNTSGGYYGYRISKAALNMFHKSFSVDFPKILSVVLHPGWVKTDMGTEAAPLTVHESTEGLWKTISHLKLTDSGRFLDHQGEIIPW